MDNSSRVGAVASSSSVSSSNGGDGSGGKPGNVDGVGGGDISVASGDGMVDEGSSDGDGGGSDSLHLSDGRGNNGRGGNSVGVVAVAEAVVVSVRVSSIAGIAQTVVSGVSGVSESVVTIGIVGVGLGISLSFPLGDMDDSGRVGDVTASSSVTSSNSGDGGSGKAGNAHGGRGGDTGVAGSNRGNSSVGIAVAKAVGVAVAVGSKTIASIASVQEVGVGLSLRGSHSGRSHAEDSLQDDCHVMWIVNHEWIYELHQEINERMNVGQWVTYKELVHLDLFGDCEEHYPLEFRAVVIPKIATHRLL